MSDWSSICFFPFISSLGLINMIIPTCTLKQIKQIKHIKYTLNKCVSLCKLSKSMTALITCTNFFFELIGCSCLTISCGLGKNIHQEPYPHLSRGKLGGSRYSMVLYTVVLIYLLSINTFMLWLIAHAQFCCYM